MARRSFCKGGLTGRNLRALKFYLGVLSRRSLGEGGWMLNRVLRSLGEEGCSRGVRPAFFLVSTRLMEMIVIPPAKNHLLSLAPNDFIARP